MSWETGLVEIAVLVYAAVIVLCSLPSLMARGALRRPAAHAHSVMAEALMVMLGMGVKVATLQ